MPRESSSFLKTAKEFESRLKTDLLSNAEYNELLLAIEELQSRPSKALRLNPLHSMHPIYSQIQSQLQDQPLAYGVNGAWILENDWLKRLEDLNLWQGAGLCFLQEPSALEVAAKVSSIEFNHGMLVDLCAAPGAKATFIGERLSSQSFLLANDINPKRAQKLSALLSRQGVLASAVFSLSPRVLGVRFGSQASVVLVDAPCSSESFFAKRKEKRRDIKGSEVRRFVNMQRECLKAAYELLRPGGELVYSTCTYNRDENEGQVEWLLSEYDDIKELCSQRRWPHIDKVPGGFWCHLKKIGKQKPEAELSFFDLQNTTEKQGLIRCSSRDWKGELDVYNQQMCGEWKGPTLDLDREKSLAYLRGEAVVMDADKGLLSEIVQVQWNGLSLGCGKVVQGRVNNLLPKTLRFS